MTDYKTKRDFCTSKADAHCKHARNYAVANVTVVFVTAILAVIAAISSQTDLSTWVTTASAGITAFLAVFTAAYNPQKKGAKLTFLSADYRRLAGRFEQLLGSQQPGADPPPWVDKLDAIQAKLLMHEAGSQDHEPITEEEWAAARPPSAQPAPATG